MVEQENLTAERHATFRAAAILRASSKQEVGGEPRRLGRR